jgi:hypothetical protein
MLALREKVRARGPVTVQRPLDLLAGAGRVVLWLAMGLVLVRGAEATLGPREDASAPQTAPAAVAVEWPDDAARALAIEFATA